MSLLDRDTWTVNDEVAHDRADEERSAARSEHLYEGVLEQSRQPLSSYYRKDPTVMTTTTADVERDVTRLADLQALIAEATSEADSIKHRLRQHYAGDPGTHEVAGHRLSVTPATRFDETLARDVLPAEVIDAATVAKLDSAAVKRMVAPTVYALCCPPSGDARVMLR